MQIRCPGCSSVLKLAKPPKAGAAVGCPKCKHRFKIKGRPAAKRKRPARSEYDEFDDFGSDGDYGDDYSDDFMSPAPRRSRSSGGKSRGKKGKGKKSSDTPAWVWPAAIGGGGLAVVSLTIIAIVMLFGDSDAKDKNKGNLAANDAKTESMEPAQPATKSPVNKPPQKKQPEPEPPPIKLPEVKAPAPPVAGGNGQLNADVLRRVKNATVMLRVTTSEGQRGSGTGFFAIDKSIVITNAHVVGMLEPGTSKPKKVEVVFQSGEPTEKVYSGYVVAVDRDSDLAVLRYRLGSTGAPSAEPLKVYSAKNLLETQNVWVFGFPFGESLGKNITVSTSSVSSLRKDKSGALKQLQVNGGIHPGNSGGPLVDSNGNVIGVAVSVILGTSLNFAIPGDSVYRMLEGRIGSVALGEAKQVNKQFELPVTLSAIDPLRRLKTVKVRWWIGKEGQPRPATSRLPLRKIDDSEHETVELTYNGSSARGTLTIPPVPEGKTIYLQPHYESASGSKYWLASIDYDPGPLLDQMKVLVERRPKTGTNDLYLNSKSTFEFRSFDGDEFSVLSNIDTALSETTQSVGNDGSASKSIAIGKTEWGLSVNNKPTPQSQRIQQAMQYLRSTELLVGEDSEGNLRTKAYDVSRVPQTAQPLMGSLSKQMLTSLDLISIPVPGQRMQPGTKWTAKKGLPLYTPRSFSSGLIGVSYTYQGVATYYRRRVAVIRIRGDIPTRTSRGITFAGTARGQAYFDLREKRVVMAHISVDVSIMAKEGSSVAKATGRTVVKLSRIEPTWRKQSNKTAAK